MSTPFFSTLSGLLLILGVFILDTTLPLGVATGTFYSLVVLVSLLSNNVALVRTSAWSSAFLLVVSTLFFPDAGVPLWIALLNRFIALLLLLATTFLGLRLVSAKQQLQAVNDQLETLSRQDGLTGLANRRHFNELLEPSRTVIVEGCYAARPELKDYYGLIVLVETSKVIRTQRQAERADGSVAWLARWDAAERFYQTEHKPHLYADCIIHDSIP